MAHLPCFEGQLFLHAPLPNSRSIPMLHVLVNTRSLYFKMRKKYQQQNGKLKLSSAII